MKKIFPKAKPKNFKVIVKIIIWAILETKQIYYVCATNLDITIFIIAEVNVNHP